MADSRVKITLADGMTPEELYETGEAFIALSMAGEADSDLQKSLKNPLPQTDKARSMHQFKALQRDFRQYIMAEIADADLHSQGLRAVLPPGTMEQPQMAKWLDAVHKVQRKRLTPAIRAFYTRAFQLGLQGGGAGRGVAPNEANLIERMRRNEYAFLDDFLKDMQHREGRMDYANRAKLYGNALQEAYWAGYTYADLSSDRYIKWKMSRAEHCPDCAFLAGDVAFLESAGYDIDELEAEHGFPVGGRWGNGVYSAQEIAQAHIFPQSGTLRCTTNCKCKLRQAARPAQEPEGHAISAPYRSIEPKEIPGERKRNWSLRRRKGYGKRVKRTEGRYHPRTEPRKPL